MRFRLLTTLAIDGEAFEAGQLVEAGKDIDPASLTALIRAGWAIPHDT